MDRKGYLGIDIGGTAVKAGLVNSKGEVIVRSETDIDRSCQHETVMQTVIRSINELCASNQIDIHSMTGIGVSSPGSVNSSSGSIAISGGNVPNWGGTKICAILDDVVCVTLGTGIGGGIISRGKLIEGRNGYAGEIGHFVTHAGGRECACGGHGCFEKYAATSALVKEGMMLRDRWYTGRNIFEDANAGDEEALALVDRWTDEVAYGIAGLVHIFNPEVILIGGGVSAQGGLVIQPVREKVNDIIMQDFTENLTVKRASLGNDAGMVGAVKHLLDEIAAGTVKE